MGNDYHKITVERLPTGKPEQSWQAWIPDINLQIIGMATVPEQAVMNLYNRIHVAYSTLKKKLDHSEADIAQMRIIAPILGFNCPYFEVIPMPEYHVERQILNEEETGKWIASIPNMFTYSGEGGTVEEAIYMLHSKLAHVITTEYEKPRERSDDVMNLMRRIKSVLNRIPAFKGYATPVVTNDEPW